LPVSQNSRPAHPFFRRLACSVVVFGCLLMASHVLSSVVKAPPAEQQQRPLMYGGNYRSVYAVPANPHAGSDVTHPMQALVSIHGHSLQITNNSPYPWRNLCAEVGSSPVQDAKAPRCPIIAPYRTRTIPLRFATMSGSPRGFYPIPVVLRWDCRTSRGDSHWCGYVPL
jgi:hypothetical protein